MWKKTLSLQQLDQFCQQSAVSHLGIRFSAQGENWLEAQLTVDERSCQPMGYLHGGVSALLAETVASLAGFCCVDDNFLVVGTEINASHLRPVKKGNTVTARATPARLGRSTQVWQIDLRDEQQQLCCSARLNLAVVNKQTLIQKGKDHNEK
ncbi:hotdog fold thioesterase [Testudinibacter sp. TR-2022]|uniref:PaaI family thioesterase n=1 Tax=Testudinibacter sp. TR-2022 TaxID=2585029 RepID=UPI0011193706|nr:hotdog fold thioesterase [Testudinibacter sp. TR-2022]TNH02150.1 hotdog fold thioesterase [Pasteurellaceae bacterium Phil31]TNH05847.1 hotdog fold thioesterase [Testudinibacter sp. TR-2022]TNH07962.1 hotdog fold thioesterase [Testudinibacter sp. TR-2022]TNH13556.1 hotdog fold thioesterase [Testudinibacter sp. TR-2022]TNH14080.1 hotdog fold thioesterase [Testudinibacter sp. TR-2022]